MKLLMNHLPKCAGNAIAQHFITLFGEDKVFEVRPTAGGLAAVPNLDDYSFIFGHLPKAWDEKLGAGRQRFSLMRDPVDRVLSAYFFYLQLKEANSPIVAEAPMMTLQEYVASENPRQKMTTCNEQSRQLLGLGGPDDDNPEEAAKYVAERAHVLDRFVCVGIYERLQESLDVVSWKLKLPRLRSGVVANRTHRNWHGTAFDESVIESIRARNRVDIELYRLVSERFARQASFMQEEMLSARYFQSRDNVGELPFTVDFAGPVTGSGWYTPEAGPQGAYRWMGGRDGASVYLPVACNGALTVRVRLTQILNVVERSGITAFLDGKPLACNIETSDEGGIVLIGDIKDAPHRIGHVLTLFTRTWRSPTPDDGRTLALAVNSVELRRGE